jgi:excisionase family DNA binding protein
MARKKAERADEKVEGVLTLDQAAAELGISRSTLQRMLRQGNIRGFKVGRQWRFRRSDLDKLSRMSHPSAAGVSVAGLDGLVADLAAHAAVTGEVIMEPVLPDYPTTEEEVAVERLLHTILLAAVKDTASDVHIDPIRADTHVRFRIDGVLHPVMQAPRDVHKALAACIKYHADIPVDQQQTAQDGRFRFRSGESEYDVRVATMPSIYGESVVMRLLDQRPHVLTLDHPKLGMIAEDMARLRRALTAPMGLIIAAGPTGSGKTSLLYAGLQHIANPEIKTITVEDPVEYSFPWVTQAAVNVRAGFTYEQAGRAIARHDPDVVMLGEIRPGPVAQSAVQIALTGHLVLSVLHAYSAAGAIVRLLDMGIEPYLLADTLLCVIAQRLIRRVCSECARPDQPPRDLLSPLVERARAGGYELPESPRFVRGAGCEHCRNTGYHGLMGMFEVLEPSVGIARLIAQHESADVIEAAAVQNGMTTLAADGLRKAAEGITTVAEVSRVLSWQLE